MTTNSSRGSAGNLDWQSDGTDDGASPGPTRVSGGAISREATAGRLGLWRADPRYCGQRGKRLVLQREKRHTVGEKRTRFALQAAHRGPAVPHEPPPPATMG